MEEGTTTKKEFPECGLPHKHWPKSDVLNPTNKSFGCPVPEPIVSSSLETLRDDVKNCFDKLKSPKVLVIVLSRNIPNELFEIIRELRTKAPLVIDDTFRFDNGE